MNTSAKDILKQLVAFPVLGGESNLEIIQWIKNYIESFEVKTYLVPNKEGCKASLHCRIGPAVDGGVILSGHTDVVPVIGQDWTTDPFRLSKRDGKFFGRGTCDMKGFLAVCLAALPKMLETTLKKPIYFVFSYDEEVGCLAFPELTEHIKNTYKETPKYAIIGEPTSLEPIVSQKAICFFETKINGSSGHSSKISHEVSAIHEAAKLINWLDARMDHFKDTSNDMRFNPSHSTIHIGKIEGGLAPNIIADKANFKWDVRTIPKDTIPDILNDFSAFCKEREVILKKRFSAFQIETLALTPELPAFNTSNESDIIKLIGKISNYEQLKGVSFASEAGLFSQYGYECIIFGPGSIDQAHKPDEFISETQLSNGLDAILKLTQLMSYNNFK